MMQLGPMPFFVVDRKPDSNGSRWAYIDRCPHGEDLGAIHLGFHITPGVKWSELTWQWEDLGNGSCRISPSILAKGVHGGQDCHFGPGTFEFMWLEVEEYRNTEPFASRYEQRTGRKVVRYDREEAPCP